MLHPQLRQKEWGGEEYFLPVLKNFPHTKAHKPSQSFHKKRSPPFTFQPKPLQKHLSRWPWKPASPSDLPKTTRFITKSCGASQIPNSGLLLPSLRATWQEEESCSWTSSSRGPQYPGFLASQSQQPACCPPPREMGPRDSSQGQAKTWQCRARLRKVPAHPLSPPGPPGDDLYAPNNLFQIQAAPRPPLQALGEKR